jgi:hypothetical protein
MSRVILIVAVACIIGLTTAGMIIAGQTKASPNSPPKREPQPTDGLVLLDYNWRAGGFGNVAVADVVIQSAKDYGVADIRLDCTTYGKSHTPLGTLHYTIFDTVPAQLTKTFKETILGRIDPQTDTLKCKITGARRQ